MDSANTWIGIIGIIIGFYLYYRSRLTPKPVCHFETTRLLGFGQEDLPKRLQVSYEGQPIERLTVTKVRIWNDGTGTLDGDALVESDPLRFEFNEGERILEANVARTTRAPIRVEIVKDDGDLRRAYLRFDFLDPKDGALISLVHDSDRRYPHVYGTIKGVPSGLKIIGTSTRYRFLTGKNRMKSLRRIGKPYLAIIASIGVLLIIAGILSEGVLFEAGRSAKGAGTKYLIIAGGVIYAALPVLVLLSMRRRYPAALSEDSVPEK
jgi:hypothetical protein